MAWNEDPLLVCTAHAAGARVVLSGTSAGTPAIYANRTARAAWLADMVDKAVSAGLDGINFDLVRCMHLTTRLKRTSSSAQRHRADLFFGQLPLPAWRLAATPRSAGQ